MFIASGVDLQRGLVQILDTNDGSQDVVALSVAAKQVKGKNAIKVWGIKSGLCGKKEQGDIELPNLNITISPVETRSAIERYWNRQIGVKK